MRRRGEPGGLRRLLQDGVVEIDAHPQHGGGGSGFFVAPGYLITCSHVVRREAGQPVSGSWHQVAWSGEVVFASSPPPTSRGFADNTTIWLPPDLAVVRLGTVFPHPCVRLAEREPLPGGTMIAVGRGAAVFSQRDELTTDELHYPGMHQELMRLTGDRLSGGMSGGPVFDLRTGDVCGMLKVSASVSESDRGGYAVPVGYLREALPLAWRPRSSGRL